jgi:hypothetical protein
LCFREAFPRRTPAGSAGLRRPPVALGEAAVFFVSFVTFVFFVAPRQVRREPLLFRLRWS